MTSLDMRKAAEVRIDVRDWRDQVVRDESLITNRDDLLAQITAGTPTGKVAKSAIISRLFGLAPDDLIKPDKLLYYTGATLAVSQVVRNEKTPVRVRNGKEYDAPRYIGNVTREEQDENGNGTSTFKAEVVAAEETEPTPPSYVDVENPASKQAALERAQAYLQGPLLGHIWNRLLIVHASGGNVHDAEARLVGDIRELVQRIMLA